MTATTLFTCTVAPSFTLISRSTPEAGAGISASTLSVEISNNGSSRWTLSPTFFSHLVMVPSKIDSPIWGITTSTPGPLGAAPPPLPPLLEGAAGAAFTGAGAWGVETPFACATDFAGGGAVFAGGGAAATALPSASMTPTTVFTCTVEPS